MGHSSNMDEDALLETPLFAPADGDLMHYGPFDSGSIDHPGTGNKEVVHIRFDKIDDKILQRKTKKGRKHDLEKNQGKNMRKQNRKRKIQKAEKRESSEAHSRKKKHGKRMQLTKRRGWPRSKAGN